MSKRENNIDLITEDMVARFSELSKQAKEIDKELVRLKKLFNEYFDLTVGKNEKGRVSFESFILERHIRTSEKYREEETVEKLEDMNLSECVKVVKKVDEEKVSAVLTLGLLPPEVLAEYKERRHVPVITVKEK
ncbi:hypothetical protein [Bacillus andreraoultii]|uniref:hypothetical protein n=1 Tax=Bacillus andreraoultii TaxID=1499685 RepID=UPI000539D739|nr:hypothetical protein [Bacillus andreraoultii]